mgnify:CR=1 FL=1
MDVVCTWVRPEPGTPVEWRVTNEDGMRVHWLQLPYSNRHENQHGDTQCPNDPAIHWEQWVLRKAGHFRCVDGGGHRTEGECRRNGRVTEWRVTAERVPYPEALAQMEARVAAIVAELRWQGPVYGISALTAEGTSRISNVGIIARGYEHLYERLVEIGAAIEVFHD